MSDYEPGTYVKGTIERDAATARVAVRLVFDGFRPKFDSETEAILADTQAMAGIEEAEGELEQSDHQAPPALLDAIAALAAVEQEWETVSTTTAVPKPPKSKPADKKDFQ